MKKKKKKEEEEEDDEDNIIPSHICSLHLNGAGSWLYLNVDLEFF